MAILAIALLAVLAFAARAQAATFTVGTTSDTTQGQACPTFPSGCSLRQLIEYENGLATTPSPVDTIAVPAAAAGYSVTNGALTITQSLSISGAGARTTTVNQAAADRVFDVQLMPSGSMPSVVISGLKISGGTAGPSNNYYGGDVRNQAILTLSEDWITGGHASSGGGISNWGGQLTVTHSLVSGNFADSGGADSGGIQNVGPNPTDGNAASLEVDNSTIAGNNAARGGGIFSWCNGTSGACSSSGIGTNSVTVANSTVAYNDGGGLSTTGGGLLATAGTMFVEHSIVAFNTVDNPQPSSASNCGTAAPGTITSTYNHNIETGSDCGFTAAGDFQNTNPDFTSTTPQNNGGNTDTLGLSANSPAIDAVGQSQPYCNGTDQRDVARPEGVGCDVGAIELVPTIKATEGGPPFSGQLVPTDCPVIGMQIDWGDGTQSAGTATGQGTHTYAEEGTYTGSISWNSDDCAAGGDHTSSFTAQVTDAALTNPSGASFSANAGQAFSGQVATFTDADPNGTASDYSATINWGDGTTSAGSVSGSSPFVVGGSHTYAAGGSYPVIISIADAGGANATATGNATVVPQARPSLTPAAPAVKNTTSAAFTASVNPEGLATAVVFEYGPALAASADAAPRPALSPRAVAYTATTPAQTVGPDYSNHTVTATVTGLLPNTTYHVRVVATNAAGTTTGPDQALKLPSDPPPPPPVLGKSVDVQVVSGLVLVKLPHGQPLYAADVAAHAAAAIPGTGFLPLTEARRLPSGTQIDARLGKIKLTAATAKRRKTETGTFNGGLFGFAQSSRGANKGLTTLSLLEGLFKGAPSYASCTAKKAADNSSPTAHAAVSNQVLQTLHSSAHGRFRTHGRYAAATVRGTGWTISDRCDGTLVSVQLHAVEVTDFIRHITVLVHQGHSYLAKAARGGK